MFRVGIIGLGYIGVQHLKNFAELADVEVAAVADINEDNIAAGLKQHAVAQVFGDYKALLELHDLDLVVVCLPNNLHAAVTIDALNAGHNVLCEKPMATTLADAEAMLAAANKNRRMLSVVKNFRWQFFGPDAFHLKQLVDAGEFGDIYYVRTHYLRRTTFSPALRDRWNLSMEASGGGVLIDLGPHMLDLAMWLLGDYAPGSVNGMIHSGLMQESEVDDFASGTVTMQSGARIQSDLAWNSHNETAWRISLYGEKGGATIDAAKPAGQRITRFFEKDGVHGSEAIAPDAVPLSPEANLQEHVVKRMRAGEAPDCSADRALQVMRVIDGWYASAASGTAQTL